MARTIPAFQLRPATLDDIPVLAALIADSARALAVTDYSKEQIEAALDGAWGVDTQLIRDGTYFVAEAGGEIVGCGGWSFRQTLFGGDALKDREPARLDPASDSARIRAFFVHPDWTRLGIGSALLTRCEQEARQHGFKSAALVATLPGQRLYAAFGYAARPAIDHALTRGLNIQFVPMHKQLA
jgi:N-acetylglutamate synthase-like GNAT family acetyltransferase